MPKYIKFHKLNKYFKFILLTSIFRLLNDYVLGCNYNQSFKNLSFLETLNFFTKIKIKPNLSYSRIIEFFFNYIGSLFLSFFSRIYELKIEGKSLRYLIELSDSFAQTQIKIGMNNIHLSNNGITAYNNMKNKYKKFSNSKINNQLKNIKQSQIKSNSSNKPKKNEANNKELMHFALSLLLDNNSTFSNVVENNALNLHHNNNNINSNNNNLNSKKNNANNKNTKANSIKKSKINYNFKNKYHNNNTNYNININNQININTNGTKDYLNTKLKNQETNNNHYNMNHQKDVMYNNFLNANSNLHSSGYGNSHNNNSENINLNKKSKGKNILMGLKKGYLNGNKNNNNENIIKSYHTKSVSSLTDLINHNKKKGSVNKNASKK